MKRGDKITFTPEAGTPREGVVDAVVPGRDRVVVTLDNDPFSVEVKKSQLEFCNQTQKVVGSPNASQLTRDAKALGVPGWQDMSKLELAIAITQTKKEHEMPDTDTLTEDATVAKAKPKAAPKKKAAPKPAKAKASTKKAAPKAKASTKKKAAQPKTKAPAKKKTAKPTKKYEGENPYRKGSNAEILFKLLVKGGKRRVLANQLAKKVEIRPYNSGKTVDEHDYDVRLILAANSLQKDYGFTIERDGRGLDGKIKAIPPS